MTTPKPIIRRRGGRTIMRLTPERSYNIPGGPHPRQFDKEEEVRVVAEIERGGDDDRGYGSKR